MNDSPPKLKVGWFSFTCCEDSTILMTELLNDYWQQWQKILDFKEARILRTSPYSGPLDVAFVEGAISSPSQEEKLKQIRSRSQKLVAIGACAVTGYPSAQRNKFDPDTIKEIQPILNRFNYFDQVKKLDELVTVDYAVPGCPMDETKFLEIITQLLSDFGLQKF